MTISTTRHPHTHERAFATSSAADKAALRRSFRRQRRALSQALQLQHAQRVARIVSTSGLLLRGGPLAAYVATAGELDPQPLLTQARMQQRTIALPAITWSAQGAHGELIFFRAERDAEFVVGRFGIREPALAARPVPADSIGLLCLPLVAYDRQGTRLGQGGGYYDRLLARWARHPANPGPLRVGLAHRCQRSTQTLPREDWDQPLDLVVTEAGLEAFTARGRGACAPGRLC